MAIEATEPSTALIQNDIVLFGLIAGTLGLIFWLSSGPTPFWKKFFTWVPALLLCYFIPGIYNSVGLIDGNASKLYNPVASRVLLPAALVLLTLTIDLKAIVKLGPKLLLMYAGASLSVMAVGVLAFLLFRALHPETVAGDTWAGMAALAGSWIGGGANMLAMKEIFAVDETTFGQFVVVDVGVGYVWMAVLIFLANRARVNRDRPTLAYAMTLGVRVPDYQVNKKFWLDGHYEGSSLFRDTLVVEMAPPPDGAAGGPWNVKYGWQTDTAGRASLPTTYQRVQDDKLEFVVPLSTQGAALSRPGITGKVRLEVSAWG